MNVRNRNIKALVQARIKAIGNANEPTTRQKNDNQKNRKKNHFENIKYDFLVSKESYGFTIWARPLPKGRPRFTINRSLFDKKLPVIMSCRSPETIRRLFIQCFLVYTDSNTEKYEKLIAGHTAEMMRAGGISRIEDKPVDIKIDAYLVNAFNPGAPDIDNIVKAVLDGMNGVIFKDDVLIRRVISEKHTVDTSEEERLTVRFNLTDVS